MKTEFWLVQSVARSGSHLKPSVPKTVKNKPSVGRNEVAIKVSLDIPNSYFQLPELRAKITLPDVRNDGPTVDVTMEQRVAEELKKSLGVNVTFEKV